MAIGRFSIEISVSWNLSEIFSWKMSEIAGFPIFVFAFLGKNNAHIPNLRPLSILKLLKLQFFIKMKVKSPIVLALTYPLQLCIRIPSTTSLVKKKNTSSYCAEEL